MYEIGGTWVTHFMGYLLQEMQRYDMDQDLELTRLPGLENDYCSVHLPGKAGLEF